MSLVQFTDEGSEDTSLSYLVAVVPALKSGLPHCGAHSVSSCALLLCVNASELFKVTPVASYAMSDETGRY